MAKISKNSIWKDMPSLWKNTELHVVCLAPMPLYQRAYQDFAYGGTSADGGSELILAQNPKYVLVL